MLTLPQKGVRQNESGRKVMKKRTEASEKVTKKRPKMKKVIELLLPTSSCGTLNAKFPFKMVFGPVHLPAVLRPLLATGELQAYPNLHSPVSAGQNP